jgi:hypothetical protein
MLQANLERGSSNGKNKDKDDKHKLQVAVDRAGSAERLCGEQSSRRSRL